MTKHTDTQRLVILFGELFNIKFNKKQFPMQLGIAKTLLLNYSYDDLVEVLNYLKDKSTNIYSLAYIPYVIDETLLKIKVEKEKQKETEKIIGQLIK